MNRSSRGWWSTWTALVFLSSFALSARAQVLTLNFGSGALPAVPLVNHGDQWRYHFGTNAPGAGWQTSADAALDPVLWGSGPGGFGYEDGDDATLITTMSNRFTTVYIRRSFDITEAVDAARHLQLVMDYDDGFVAWLDGVEIARSPNAPGAVGSEPANTATSLAPNHEASAGAGGNAPTVLDLGLVGSRMDPGTHVLATMGLNGSITSSDLSLIADLSLTGGSSSVSGGNFFTIVTTSPIAMSGSNTFPGSARVSINGVDAAFNPGAGTWSRLQPLTPGLNRLFIAALDANGAILAATNRDVIYEAASVSIGGALAGNTTWNSASGIVRVTNDVIVPNGATLNIDEGVVVLLPANVSIRATAGGVINVNGTEANPCFFLPASGSGNWGAINANGSGASLNLRHIETAGGAITFNNQATGLIEDSFLHDRGSILTGNGAGLITTRRIHVMNYDETIYNSGTPVLAEDSLYEGLSTASSDALEIQGGLPGSVVRRCTFRRSVGSNSDAVDFNGTSGALVDSCLIHDFTDKAISMGASGQGGSPDYGIVISNCLIYNVDTGIAVKDNGTASLYDTTVSQCVIGLSLYQKFTTPIGGGHITNGFNNVIWGNGTSISATEGGTVTTDYSDVQGGVWPGTGNIEADPLFVDTDRGDFRVGAGSLAEQASASGGQIGVRYPVGGLPSAPFHLAALVSGNNPIQLTWQEDADNESGFALQRSVDGANWIDAGDSGRGVTNVIDNITLPDVLYFYRVRATNSSGFSRYSNLASAIRRAGATIVSGTLSGDTIWSPALGEIHVVGNVTVPNGVTLTIQPGTVIKLTNTTALRASAGGTISVDGTEAGPVLFTTLNGTNVWSELAADGANSFLTIRHAEIIGGAVKFRNGATGLMEDTYVHNYKSGSVPIAGCTSAISVTVRRCHFARYHETLWQNTLMLIEESLFEWADNPSSDALDFDGAVVGSAIRRCTFRHGPQSNTDAIDIGPTTSGSGSTNTIIEDCLMFNFPNDKGVSIGEGSYGIVVRNCLMYGNDSGVAVKDSPGGKPPCTANVYNCTIVENDYGYRCYNKSNPTSPTDGGQITNSYNNIIWNNSIAAFSILNDGILTADHTDFGLTSYPGAGNFDADPLFVNAAQRDYRLAANSPCIGVGRDGATLGATFPVGAPMAPSHPSISRLNAAGGNAIIGFWADSEKTYALECSPNVSGGPWTSIASVPTNAVPRFLSVTNAVAPGNRFYRLVSP